MRWRTIIAFAVVSTVVSGAFVLGVPLVTDVEYGDGGISTDEVEQEFQRLLNEERASRDLQNLRLREDLRSMGDIHATNMMENDYIGHEWPDGTDIEDRYSERGLLPECRLPVADSDRFYPGAENAAGAHVETEYVSGGETYDPDTSEELAAALFDQWMNSPGHREAMLVPSADAMGLGIAINDDGEVWAALELC